MSKKVRRQAIGVALFPFLAVLICTMGALIVLLVLLVQQARLDAHDVVKNKQRTPPPVDPLAAERKIAQEKIEDEQWRQGMLEQQRLEQAEVLASSRVKVAHLEDHIRRLQDQARALMTRAQEIDRGETAKIADVTAEQTELAKLQAEIARRKTELEDKKKKLAEKDRSFALIPYDGPNGTKRRPIYIECRIEGVVLQPEGLILGPADFSGPMNPGNPLDAALRTIREAWKRSGEPGEPYPLLVVRPSGIVAYQAARQALRGWDDEFGYELVSDEKRLDYGSPNPAMQSMLEEVVGKARERQVMLAAAMPRKFQDDDTLTSFSPQDQPEFQAAVNAARGSGGVGNGNGEFAGGAGSIGGNGGYNPGSNAPGIGNPQGTYGAPGNPGTGPGIGPGTAGGGPNAQFAASSVQANSIQANSIQANRAGQGGATGGSGAANNNTGANAGANGQYSTGQTSGGGGSSTGRPTTNINTGQMAGQGSPSGSASGSPNTNSAAASGSNPGGTPSVTSGAKSSQQRAGNSRTASNWGLPGAQGRTTAVTRPIRVVCLPDRLVVVPERGDDRAVSTIAVSPQMKPEEADAFVKAVQKHLDAWGPAMTNGYWKPVLQVEVTRAGEGQFTALQQMLNGSGFDLQRKTP
ncbi:hypothetical protein ETAA8_25460 [Anatilimnocola aggregata]|uniref:Uncharacterized protein n=1 Tax=Anatilimnocola aggregata TaxID=2528021 RepID=A0A517YB36_9BACT|nr:hypothetical protein [Anatilimnocola aggregata]QDU27458.1 hypothetical protein ETAA8_25460 [Anatilimnocola aggregata]